MSIVKHSPFFFLFLLILTAAHHANAYEVTTQYNEFYDQDRDRTIPYKLYKPQAAPEPAPVLIFSHGLGGSVEAAEYLGQGMAEHGYYAFFIQHPGTDDVLIKSANRDKQEILKNFKKSYQDPKGALERYADIPSVIDGLEKLNASDPELKGKLDLSKIGMAGHSYGARSTMVAAGQKFAFFGSKFKDDRIKAAVALSPNVFNKNAKNPNADLSSEYENIDIPVFHVTGTEDGSGIGKYFPSETLGSSETKPDNRILPYKNTHAANQYLVVFDGAEHATFGGRSDSENDKRVQALTVEATALFFDGYLKGDQASLEKLKNDFSKDLSNGDHFEYK